MEDQAMMPSKSKMGGSKVVIMLLLLIIAVTLVGLVVFIVVKPVKIELSQLDPQIEATKNLVSVSGTGKIKVVPDVATVRIGTFTVAETTEKAQEDNAIKINSVLVALRDLNIEDKDIQTSSYEVRPEYEWENNKNVDKGFRASQTVTVTIRNLDDAGKILTKSSQAGANDIGGVNFVVEDIESYKTQALEEAYKNAEERAQKLAQSSGKELGEVISLKESGVDVPTPLFYGLEEAALADSSAEKVIPEIPTGEEEITSRVEVVYEIK